MFLALGKNFKIENKEWKKEEVLIDVEDILYNEKREEEEERDRVRRKVTPIVERANENKRDNLTLQEIRGMREIKRRKDVVIQAVDEGGAIVVTEKEWYKERMKEQVIEGYRIRKVKEEIIRKMVKSSEGGCGKKGLGNKRRKYINKEGTIQTTNELAKTHTEEVGIRPVVNGRGSVLEGLEEEMAKVFRVVEIRQEGKKKLKKQRGIGGGMGRCVFGRSDI